MKLRIRCQICGRNKTFDTIKSSGSKPRWEMWKITDLVEEVDQALDYEIWICPDCQTGHYTREIDEEGKESHEFEVDMEQLVEMLKKKTKFEEDELKCSRSPKQ